MHVIAPLIGKVALVQKPSGQSPGTRNPPGQEIPGHKKSPGTRNPPGQKFPGTKIPRDKNPPGQKSPGKSRAGTASIYIKWKQKKSVLPYLLPQF